MALQAAKDELFAAVVGEAGVGYLDEHIDLFGLGMVTIDFALP